MFLDKLRKPQKALLVGQVLVGDADSADGGVPSLEGKGTELVKEVLRPAASREDELATNSEKRAENLGVKRESQTPELLTRYLEYIGRGKLLTHQEEIDLSNRAEAGDNKAR